MPPSQEFDYDVFLSHSAKDKTVVRPLAERLRQDGLRVWFDEWVLRPGDRIPAKIEDGLEHSRVLVLCMSANAFGSDWAQLEAGTFRFRDPLNKERRFIPLRLDAAPIKGSLAQFLYINWLRSNREQEYRKLLAACRPVAEPPTEPSNPLLDRRVDQALVHESTHAVPPSTRCLNHGEFTVSQRPVGDAWSGLRGLLQQAYSTKVIKGILGKAGLPIARIKYPGNFKGPVLDEADRLVSALDDGARHHFAVACIQEILEFERVRAARMSESGAKPDDQVVQDLQTVLARFGHDLGEFQT